MKALITDDMFTSRIQIGIVLRSMGYVCDEAANGAQAIEKLEKNQYDLILMDIEMPVMNGLETTRYIREKRPGNPEKNPLILAITAHNPEEFENSFKQLGFDGFISKPVTVEKIQRHLPV